MCSVALHAKTCLKKYRLEEHLSTLQTKHVILKEKSQKLRLALNFKSNIEISEFSVYYAKCSSACHNMCTLQTLLVFSTEKNDCVSI